MIMTNGEIYRRYKNSVDMKVLAELNGCSLSDISEIINNEKIKEEESIKKSVEKRQERTSEEKDSIKNYLLEGLSIQEVMQKLYGHSNSGTSDYRYVASIRSKLKKDGLLKVDPIKMSSNKSPNKVDLVNKSNELSADTKLVEAKDFLKTLDINISKAKRKLETLESVRSHFESYIKLLEELNNDVKIH